MSFIWLGEKISLKYYRRGGAKILFDDSEKEGLVRKGEFFAILTVGGQFCYGLLNLICKKSSSDQTSPKFRLIALLNVIRLADFQLFKYER